MRRWVWDHQGKITRKRLVLTLGFGLSAWYTLLGAESSESLEIKEQLTRQIKRIQSLEVVSRLETKTELAHERLRSLPDFHNQVLLPKEEDHEAFKGEKRYRRVIQPERVEWIAPTDRFGLVPPEEVDPKAPAAVQERQKSIKKQYDYVIAEAKRQEARGVKPRRPDPKILDPVERDVTHAYNGRSLWRRRPRSKVFEYQVKSASSPASAFQVSAYLSAVGLHVPDPTLQNPMARTVQGMFQIATWVRDRGYAAEPGTEVIDGSTCVVLKGSLNSLAMPSLLLGELSDRIWLDRDHGFVVRKRELARSGQVTERWENSELREVATGLWLPLHIRRYRFPYDPPADLQGKPALVEEIHVDRIEVNRVQDDLFDMAPEANDIIEDLRGQP